MKKVKRAATKADLNNGLGFQPMLPEVQRYLKARLQRIELEKQVEIRHT